MPNCKYAYIHRNFYLQEKLQDQLKDLEGIPTIESPNGDDCEPDTPVNGIPDSSPTLPPLPQPTTEGSTEVKPPTKVDNEPSPDKNEDKDMTKDESEETQSEIKNTPQIGKSHS